MKIQSVPSPATPSAAQSSPSGDARARAMAALLGTPPAVDQNNVSPEESSAVAPPVEAAPPGDKNTSVEPSEASDAPKEEKAPEEPLSSQYAQLARKEKALRAKAQQQEAALRAREQALVAREEAIKAKDSEYQSNYIAKNRLTEDTWGVLSEAGVTYEKLTEMALNQPAQQDPATKAYLSKLEAKIAELEAKTAGTQKSIEDQQTGQYQQAIKQLTNEAKLLVSSDPQFETIKETSSVGEVVELIERTFKEEGVLMSVEEAAKAVEDYLIEEGLKIARIKKIQERLKPASVSANAQASPGKQNPVSSAPKQPQPTLTNSVGASRQ